MTRYMIHKDGRLIGAMELSNRLRKHLEDAGYRLLPA